jgi:hypothetical protein
MNDFAEMLRAYPNVKYRYFIQASEEPLPDWELINFNPTNIQRGIDLGIKDTKAVLSKSHGEGFQQYI